MDFPEDFRNLFSYSFAEFSDNINSLTGDELAELAKNVATDALNRLFDFFNEALEKYKLQYRYDFAIRVLEKDD